MDWNSLHINYLLIFFPGQSGLSMVGSYVRMEGITILYGLLL
jgi:hypothetical protein